MNKIYVQSIKAICVFTLITGVIYPLVLTAIGQFVFPHQANGSLIVQNGQIMGSELIGQTFTDPKYFWGRPSATTPFYNGAASSGSNWGPLHPNLAKNIQEKIEALRRYDPASSGLIPIDLVTASGSGLDPHISPASARYQINRIAHVRETDPKILSDLIDRHLEGRQLGILGEPRINVLQLNLALDRLAK